MRRLSPGRDFAVWPSACPGPRPIRGARETELFGIVTGFVQSQILFAALQSGLLDALTAGPVGTSELSARTGLPPDRLRRLLQGAQSIGLIGLGRDGYVTLDDHGSVIAADGGLRAMIHHHALLYRDLADPLALFDGSRSETEMRRLWSYAGSGRESAVQPGDAAAYSALMAASQSMLSDEILDAYDFGRHHSLIDIGGGEGAFLSAVAARFPGLRLSLFDLPPVAARAREKFSTQALGDCPRCHAGSFFDDPLPRGHDCVTLVRVLFDHEDSAVLRLLHNVRSAMEPGQTLVIAEPMAGDRSRGQRYATAYFGTYVLAMGSGRCRAPEEIGALARQAGFARFEVTHCRSPLMATIVVAFP
ncbi:methyltransferase [Hoeflea sp.]|uniref:methyltransferase n=1 Tax=Hoeflea sp. TaxID=1940281 RepID=UPI003B52FE1B